MKKKSVIILILLALVIAVFVVYIIYTEIKFRNMEIEYGLGKAFKSYISLYFLSSPIRVPFLYSNSTITEIKSRGS